jgi:hypothetical protein
VTSWAQDWTRAIAPFVGSIVGPCVAAVWAIHQARKTLAQQNQKDAAQRERERVNLIRSLKGELTANIYLLLDIRSETSEGISVQRKILDANAGRASVDTSRAFAWLSVIYARLESAASHSSIDGGRMKVLLGHAISIHAGLTLLEDGSESIQLSGIDPATLEANIAGFTAHEQALLTEARSAWLHSVLASART